MTPTQRAARGLMWLRFVWNDHNFEPMHKEAKRIVDALGVHSLEEAEAWMEREFAEPAFPHVAQGGEG